MRRILAAMYGIVLFESLETSMRCLFYFYKKERQLSYYKKILHKLKKYLHEIK